MKRAGELISIIIPCLNEEKYIRGCIESVLSFQIPVQEEIEILVLDGGSTDRTRSIVRELCFLDPRIRMIENPGRIQSCALNLGIAEARGEWVMRLDAHAMYPPDYLLRCYETAQEKGAHNTGGVCITRPGGEGYIARLVQALMTHRFGVGNSGFRTGVSAGPRDTVPFGFFCRRVFDQIGLFDERLARTQDYELNRRLVAMGGLIYLDPSIVSLYYAPASFRAILKKFVMRQGPYVAYMWFLAPHAFSLRHVVPLVFVLGVLVLSVLFIVWPASWWLLCTLVVVYLAASLAASVQQAIRYDEPWHLLFLPLSFFAYHLSYGVGILIGLLRLLLGNAPVQKISEPWAGYGAFRVKIRRRVVSKGCTD